MGLFRFRVRSTVLGVGGSEHKTPNEVVFLVSGMFRKKNVFLCSS